MKSPRGVSTKRGNGTSAQNMCYVEETVLEGEDASCEVSDSEEPVTKKMKAIGNNRAWKVDSILFRNGYKHATKTLKAGVWYGCANNDGGVESYYALESRATRSGLHAMTENVVRETVELFCRRHKGVAVIMGGPGARKRDPAMVRYFRKNNRSLVACSSEFDCIQAESSNAIALQRGVEGYHRATLVWKKYSSRLSKLGQGGPVIVSMGLKLELRKPKHLIAVLQNHRFDRAFNIIAEFSCGLWMVVLQNYDRHRVEHCVLVDANQKIILDSEEEYPITLCAQSLRMSAGSGCRKLQVTQVIELCDTK